MQVDSKLLFALWESELKNDEIAERLGMTRSQLFGTARRFLLPPRPKNRAANRTGAKLVDPTPEEILERAAAIRANWTPEIRAQRCVGGRKSRWTAPAFRSRATTTGRSVSFARATHEF